MSLAAAWSALTHRHHPALLSFQPCWVTVLTFKNSRFNNPPAPPPPHHHHTTHPFHSCWHLITLFRASNCIHSLAFESGRSGSRIASRYLRKAEGSLKQCCGSGMFIPDPNFYPSRIPDLGSRIPDPGSKNRNKREGWKKICCHTFFVATNFTKL